MSHIMSTLDKSNCPEAQYNKDWTPICDETCPYYGCVKHPFEDPYMKMCNSISDELTSLGYECFVEKYIFNQVCEKMGIDPDEIDLDDFYESYGFSIE